MMVALPGPALQRRATPASQGKDEMQDYATRQTVLRGLLLIVPARARQPLLGGGVVCVRPAQGRRRACASRACNGEGATGKTHICFPR